MENIVTEKKNHDRIDHLLRFLNSGLYGKEEAVRLALLSAVAGESIFFLGPPGTAKSMISRRIKDAFKDETTYFEYLLNEFSTPDEICGPVSLKGLEDDEYKRITKGCLPEANIAFLDEIWKAGPAILNTLLSIINEKKYHNGCTIDDVPLVSLVTASNELPPENRGLEALWDRLMIRVQVNPVQEEDVFFKAVTRPTKDLIANDQMKDNQITFDNLKDWLEKINNINVPEQVKNVITAIRQELVMKNNEGDHSEKEKYYVSDRRWKKIIHLLRTSAFLNDRNEVDLMDCQLIQYCIWSTEEQMKEAREIVEKIAQDYGLECNTAIDDINDQIEVMNKSIDETWYKEKQSVPVICKIKNIECYKTHDDNKTIFYFSREPDHSYSSSYYKCFDANKDEKNQVTNMKISDDIKSLKCNMGTYSIEWTKTSIIKNGELFSNPEAYDATKDSFDKKHYTPIYEQIKKEQETLEKVHIESEKPFSINLFAEKSFAEMLLSKMASSKKELEDALVNLDKARARYEQE